MDELFIAIGLIFFIEGFVIAMFPSKIKSMLETIKNTPENKLRLYGVFFLIVINFSFVHSKPVPDSFADLADKLMPSVVNISTTQTVRTTSNQFPFQFPPGSPFEEMFKDFQRPTERKASSLGSGFIINENGTIVTNNHVIADAEDILVRVNNKEFKAKVLGSDPYGYSCVKNYQ